MAQAKPLHSQFQRATPPCTTPDINPKPRITILDFVSYGHLRRCESQFLDTLDSTLGGAARIG